MKERRSIRVDSESLILLRIVGAVWLLLEWLFVLLVVVTSLYFAATDGGAEPFDDTMRLIDWIDMGVFMVWAAILISLPAVVAVALFRDLRGDVSQRIRTCCVLVAGANVILAAWNLISLGGATVPAEIFFTAVLLLTGVVALGLGYSGPRVAQPASA